MGSEEAVEDCKDHLLNLQEEFMQDVESGEFVPAAPVDVSPLLETENAELCSSLNEFDKIKRAIRSKWSELENQ